MISLQTLKKNDRFRNIKRDIIMDLTLIKRRDKGFQELPYLMKNQYLKDNHPRYVKKIEDLLLEAGEMTIQEGDSESLDTQKEFLFNALFL